MSGFFKSLRESWKNTTDPAYVSKSLGARPFFDAVIRRDYATVRKIAAEKTFDLNQYSLGGETAFHMAVKNGAVDMARVLVELGADVRLPVKGLGAYDSPVHLAITAGRPEMIPFLKSIGFSLTAPARNGWTPLRHSIALDNALMIRTLIQEGADPLAVSDLGRTAVFSAVAEGKKNALAALMDNPYAAQALYQPVIENRMIIKPVFSAIERGHTETAVFLFDQGMNVNICNMRGETPLHLAVMKQDIKLARYLLENGADLNKAYDSRGHNPFQLLCGRASGLEDGFLKDCFKLFLKHGADIKGGTAHGVKTRAIVESGQHAPLQKIWRQAERKTAAKKTAPVIPALIIKTPGKDARKPK